MIAFFGQGSHVWCKFTAAHKRMFGRWRGEQAYCLRGYLNAHPDDIDRLEKPLLKALWGTTFFLDETAWNDLFCWSYDRLMCALYRMRDDVFEQALQKQRCVLRDEKIGRIDRFLSLQTH